MLKIIIFLLLTTIFNATFIVYTMEIAKTNRPQETVHFEPCFERMFYNILEQEKKILIEIQKKYAISDNDWHKNEKLIMAVKQYNQEIMKRPQEKENSTIIPCHFTQVVSKLLQEHDNMNICHIPFIYDSNTYQECFTIDPTIPLQSFICIENEWIYHIKSDSQLIMGNIKVPIGIESAAEIEQLVLGIHQSFHIILQHPLILSILYMMTSEQPKQIQDNRLLSDLLQLYERQTIILPALLCISHAGILKRYYCKLLKYKIELLDSDNDNKEYNVKQHAEIQKLQAIVDELMEIYGLWKVIHASEQLNKVDDTSKQYNGTFFKKSAQKYLKNAKHLFSYNYKKGLKKTRAEFSALAKLSFFDWINHDVDVAWETCYSSSSSS